MKSIYDYETVARRLAKLRRERKLSPEKLAAEINNYLSRYGYSDTLSETAIRTYESPSKKAKAMGAPVLLALSKFFRVEPGYILGTQSAKISANKEITNDLGLTDNSIKMIEDMKKVGLIGIFNRLLEEPELQSLLLSIDGYMNLNNARIQGIAGPPIAFEIEKARKYEAIEKFTNMLNEMGD